MKISVLVPGRLHGFEMALYFQKLGLLNELVTGYPKKYVKPFGIELQLVVSLYLNEMINRCTNYLGLGYPLDFIACEAFDFLASKLIKFDSDVYFIWSGYALKTIKKIRQKNPEAQIILVRGSAHITIQEALLKKINNTTKQQINSKIILKELAEYEATDYITVPSTFAKNSFIDQNFSPQKIFLNLLGVNLIQFPFKQKCPNQIISIGYVGTISKQKNIESLIYTIAELNNVENRFRLILAGPIEHESFDEKMISRFTFISYYGKLPQENLCRVYHQIDVFVLNTVQDGFGMVLLQAMSCGCPIIATCNSGGPDIINNYENGIIIPAFDPESLKHAIDWFFQNKDNIQKMGKKSRIISENGFTWDDFGRRNIEFMHQILEQ